MYIILCILVIQKLLLHTICNSSTSLSALGNCIAALAERGRKHVPFRDSTLTRLLQVWCLFCFEPWTFTHTHGNNLNFMCVCVYPMKHVNAYNIPHMVLFNMSIYMCICVYLLLILKKQKRIRLEEIQRRS
jgi:hypothetical protein